MSGRDEHFKAAERARAMEAQALKDLRPQAVDSPGQLAPEPPVLLFKSYQMDILHGIDPVSGSKITNLVFTSGNYAIQVIIPVPSLNLAGLVRELQRGLGPVPDGVPTPEDFVPSDTDSEG